ncbi:hypothetical protein Tco_1336411 [Tanacetum coccineum]
MKLATERSLIETHSSHASGSGADERTSSIPGVPVVPTYGSDDEQISWKSSDEEEDDEVALNDDDDDNDDDDANDDDDVDDADNQDAKNQDDDYEQTDSDNDGDDFVHPKFSTHDEENKDEDSFNPRVQTPSHVESTDDEDSDEEIQDENVEGDKMNEEETNEEAEVDALYRDVNVNLEERDTEMTDAPHTIVQITQVIEDTHVIIILVNPEGQQQSSFVSSSFVSNMLNSSPYTDTSLSATTLPPPPTPLITHLQQTPVPTPPTVLSSSLQDLPNFGSLFGFDHRLKTLENNFSEFNQTNQFVAAVYSITGIPRRQPNLKLELKKILIDKMESNKSIHISDEQKNLYKALVDAYESDKLILDTYGDTVSFKRRRDDKDCQIPQTKRLRVLT